MSQRNSGYERQPDDVYETPAWVVRTVLPFLPRRQFVHAWDPANGPASKIATTLRDIGYSVVATDDDFLARTAVPPRVNTIICNPPYGIGGRLACKFIAHALALVPHVAMLLRIDFDSAKTRTHLFRDHQDFAGKIVLLDRIVWFERKGAPGPSENHCWAIWDRRHRGQSPTIRYAGNDELKSASMFDEVLRGFRAAQVGILTTWSESPPDASGES